MTLPALFIAHGAPDLPLSTTPARAFTQDLGKRFPGVRAILVISAHWEARLPTIGTAAAPPTIHDFGGFDDRLYSMAYPARTSAAVVAEVADALKAAGIAFAEDARRGYDHGVWIPLMLAFPRADVPVVQLSLRHGASAAENVALGKALAPLRDKGVLIVGSGAIVHNLRAIAREGTPAPDWAKAVDDYIVTAVEAGDEASLLRVLDTQGGRIAHPTPEHLMPLFVALGAGGGSGHAIHRSFTWGSISMTSFAFGEEKKAA
ncbi:dioxygenase [Aestuariivirga litoralis]|uniref:Dioxygenase n=1 Tax=Aestuariivirga litoralis TaxID=2650924 RepID=A0A2W2ATE1_9HYPH|nr:class III extradiol ring-cleavage dioxygenase [Aestuariivirga litoralis]PZF78575.1 dioxygenase [Aestuariivirga litoralis]